MTRSALPLLGAAMLLSGCVDFVDPVGLQFSRPNLLSVAVRVDDRAIPACGNAAPSAPAPGEVSVCVQAELVPGRDRTGDRLRVLDPTLSVLGRVAAPVLQPDSSLVYAVQATLPRERLADTVLVVRFPVLEEMPPATEIRWTLVEPAGPDTITRPPGGDVRIPLELPARASEPRPGFQFWGMSVSGSAATAGYNAFGRPHAAYDFPAEVLAGLGGDRFRAELSWRQSLSTASPSGATEVNVSLEERLHWTVVTEAPPSGGRGR